MKLTRLSLLFALAACQMESTGPSTESTESQSLVGGDYCTAKFPSMTTWDGKPPPQLATGVFVVRKTKYTGWWVSALVDVSTAKIAWAKYVHDTSLNQFTGYTIRAGLVGPGGGPPQPPCEMDSRCGQELVAFAQRVELARSEAVEDADSCSSKLP